MGDLNQSVLIVGGAGFLGSHLTEGLADDYNLIVLDTFIKYPRHLALMKDIIYLDVLSTDIEELFKNNRIDFIVNCSILYGDGIPLSKLIQNNVVAPLNLLETANKYGYVKVFLNADSFFNKPQNEMYQYLKTYTLTKHFLEKSLMVSRDKTSIYNLKIEHMYGPGDNPNKFVPSIIHQLLENTEILLTSGEQIRDFIFVKDVVSAFKIIIENHGKLGDKYFNIEVGNGSPVSIKEFVNEAFRLAESQSVLKFGALDYREGEIKYSIADVGLLNELGWQPEYNLKAGLLETITYEKRRLNGEV